MSRPVRLLGYALLAVLVAGGCGVSRATAPPEPAKLPRFTFAALKGTAVQLLVLDHRAEAINTEAWVHRVTSDISGSLSSAGVTVTPSGTSVLEIRIHHLRTDFEKHWKGCAKLAATLSRSGGKVEALGERCTEKKTIWTAAGAADAALKVAYHDALAELLSSLDSKLR
jgi:hypothetical protein